MVKPVESDAAELGDWRAGGWSDVGDVCCSRKLFIRPVKLYFLFQAFAFALAFWAPAEICSWCRSRKLLAVEAAVLASAKVTDEGSLWKL